MRKILLLGGAAHQVIAIRKAKEIGIYTVICDWNRNCPGATVADRFYEVSTTDWDGVYEVARKEKVDGVFAYASDPAALTAAFVQKKLHLPYGIPLESVKSISDKLLFRELQKKYRFGYPRFIDMTYGERVTSFGYRMVVKPTDSSGSKGVSMVENADELTQAWAKAYRNSRTKRIIGEEFLHTEQRIIGGDVLVVNGHVEILGLLDCLRDKRAPMIPVGKNYPAHITQEEREQITNEFQRLVNLLDIKNLEMNVELVFDEEHQPVIMDIGPRCGGNRIPEFLSKIYGIDLTSIAIRMALGERTNANLQCVSLHGALDSYRSLYVLHTYMTGRLKEIQYMEPIRKYITEIHLDVKPGSRVDGFSDASKKLGTIFLWFPDTKTQEVVMMRVEEYIAVLVDVE